MTFDEACALVESVLNGTTRRQIVNDVSRAKDFRTALLRLRDSMRSNAWKAGAGHIGLGRIIRTFDARTRDDGFHVLHDWDGKADTVNDDSIPVDVLHYLIDKRGDEPVDPAALAILLDYYFFHVLALLSVRIWDDGDPGNGDANLDRLNQLLDELQGPNGGGQRFVDNAETLILIATSHFELHERGYDKLLQRVKTLNRAHQTSIALGHASSIGGHLRFGFEATYARDTIVMRDDNVADYPWLCFALATLMREYARGASDAVAEAMLNGLTADARAFVGQPPAALASCEVERSGFRELFLQHRQSLLDAFERHRPSERTYSPISFFFNFSHNIIKGTVIDALLRSAAWPVTFNDLLTSLPRGDNDSKTALATTLMGYARANPDTIRGRLMPVIVYDPQAGHQAFAVAMRKIRE